MTFNSLLKAVENLSNHVQVEMINEEIRVSGRTYFVRGKLKLLGFRWNPQAREWYYPTTASSIAEHEFELPTTKET